MEIETQMFSDAVSRPLNTGTRRGPACLSHRFRPAAVIRDESSLPGAGSPAELSEAVRGKVKVSPESSFS